MVDILLCVTLCLGLRTSPAATPLQGTNPDPELSGPFLRIDGEEIGGDEFGRWLLSSQGEHQARDFAVKVWVIDREAKRLGLETPVDEVRRAVDAQIRERIDGAFLGSREDWLAELARTGRSEAGVRRQRQVEMRPELEARAIAAQDRVVPQHLIEREWELRFGRKGRRYDLRMIQLKVVVPSLPHATREEWEAGRQKAMDEGLDKARSIRERALQGEDFGLLAARLSDDPDTRDHRGVPSGGFRHFGWPGRFLDALEALQAGEILQPTYARGGWWIVELRSVHVTPLESVRHEIEADLVARGPEPYEVGLVQDRLSDGIVVQTLPGMLAEPSGGEWPDSLEPVLRIDGEPVARGEYARWLLDTIGETLVDTFAEEWLVRRKAKAAGIVVDEKEVADRTRESVQALIDSGYHGDRGAWITYIQRGGRTEEAFLRDVTWRTRIALITEKLSLREREVQPGDVRARFVDVYGKDGRRVEVRCIRLPIRMSEPAKDLTREELARRMGEASDATRLRAQALVARARAGEDFASLARAASEDLKTRDAGGTLPGRFRPDAWPEGIAKAVLALGAEEISDPLLQGRDWLIFQVASVRQVAFEDVEAELERELATARPSLAELACYRNALLKQARVEVLPAMQR